MHRRQLPATTRTRVKSDSANGHLQPSGIELLLLSKTGMAAANPTQMLILPGTDHELLLTKKHSQDCQTSHSLAC